MTEGYELSEDAARRTAAAVRRVEAMTPAAGAAATRGRNVPHKPAFYRLANNLGDGKYTCRRQAWDDDAKAFADVAESHQAEHDVEVTAYDYQERADGVAGFADVGQIVRGWKIHVGGATRAEGTWITLVDVGDELRITSKDIRAAHARSTAAELAETPTKPHKIVGDNEAHLPGVAAGAGWIEAEVLGADVTNQQLLIKHVGPGPLVYTGCGIELDGLGHVRRSYVGPGWVGPCA